MSVPPLPPEHLERDAPDPWRTDGIGHPSQREARRKTDRSASRAIIVLRLAVAAIALIILVL